MYQTIYHQLDMKLGLFLIPTSTMDCVRIGRTSCNKLTNRNFFTINISIITYIAIL